MDLKYENNISQKIIDKINLTLEDIFMNLIKIAQVRTFKTSNYTFVKFKLFH